MANKKWNKKWKASVLPRKQRKYAYNAPLHVLRKLLSVHLSKELRQKYGKRNIKLRKEDTVKILRGQFKGKIGKVARIDVKHQKIYVDGVNIIKRDGSKIFYPINPSNLMITELYLDDKIRKKILERK